MLALNPRRVAPPGAVWVPDSTAGDPHMVSGSGEHDFNWWRKKAKLSTWNGNPLSVTIQVRAYARDDSLDSRASKTFGADELKQAKAHAEAYVAGGGKSAHVDGRVEVRYEGSGTFPFGEYRESNAPDGWYLWLVDPEDNRVVERLGPYPEKPLRDGEKQATAPTPRAVVLTYGADPRASDYYIDRWFKPRTGEMYGGEPRDYATRLGEYQVPGGRHSKLCTCKHPEGEHAEIDFKSEHCTMTGCNCRKFEPARARRAHTANHSRVLARSQEIREGSKWIDRSTGYRYIVTGVSDSAIEVTPAHGKGHIDDQANIYSFANFVADFTPLRTAPEYAANRPSAPYCAVLSDLFPEHGGVRFLADQDRGAVVLADGVDFVYLVNPLEYEQGDPERRLWILWVKGSRLVRIAWWGQVGSPREDAMASVSDWLDATCFPGLSRGDETQSWGVDFAPGKDAGRWEPIIRAAAVASAKIQKEGTTMRRNAGGLDPGKREQAKKQLAEYGYELTDQDQIQKGPKVFSVVVSAKGPRFYVKQLSGASLWSGPSLGNFLESFWFAKKLPQGSTTMKTNTTRRYSRLEDNPQLYPEKFGVRFYAVTERGGGIGGLSPVDKESERVVLVDQDAREYILVNPLEYDKDATVHVFHFGAYGDLNLIYLYAGRREGIEDGLEECGSWLAEHAPGHIIKPGSEEYMDLFNEAKQELIDDGEDPDDEELDGKAEEQAMTDQTYTESGWIASHEWGVTTLDGGDDVAKAALYVSKKLYAEQYDEEDEDEELEPNSSGEVVLRDRASGHRIFLTLRDGVVVGAMGADPKRYVGLTEEQARRKARYGQK